MKNLVIVESPSKSKTIEKYLGEDYEVVSSKGHIRDLAIKGKDGLGVDVEDKFTPTYVVNKDKKQTVKELKALAKKADHVFLATDPDREGEAISWHLASELDVSVEVDNRIVFHEVTKDAVLEAFKNPRRIDMNLVRSQETRRILDRIIGFKLSKLLKSKIKSKSAGRVQSVALQLIVHREKEINAFNPVEYWTIDAKFEEQDIPFDASLSKIDNKKAELHNEQEAMEVVQACQSPFEISSVKKQVRKREPKLAYITSTLQQDASTKINFSAKKTMTVAQRLYEGIEMNGTTEGLITYMRTDSTRLSPVFINSARSFIENEYGEDYLGVYKVKKDDKAQDAHEAIRPTYVEKTPESVKSFLTPDQYKLYKLIWCRAVSSLMAAAKNNTVSVTLSNGKYDFSASGTQLVFDGYLKVAKEFETSKDVLLPELDETQKCTAKEVKGNQHFTEPPLRYSEARLIKEMEEEGIGRPSTYSMIIDTIQARGYVVLEKASESSKTKVFFPTEQGTLTCDQLSQFFEEIINVKYTAQMENSLDEIAEGTEDNVKSLQEFYDKFVPLIDNAYEKMEKKEAEKTGDACPECGNDLVYRVGRFGKFISCSTYPECKYTQKIEVEKEKPEPSGKMCPECGNELLKRKSRYGNYFLGCSNFPKCKHIENIEGQEGRFKKSAKTKKEDKE